MNIETDRRSSVGAVLRLNLKRYIIARNPIQLLFLEG